MKKLIFSLIATTTACASISAMNSYQTPQNLLAIQLVALTANLQPNNTVSCATQQPNKRAFKKQQHHYTTAKNHKTYQNNGKKMRRRNVER